MWRNRQGLRIEGEAERCDVTGKIIYPTNKAARHAAIGFKRRAPSRFREGESLQVFECNGHFHIGHKRPNQNSRDQKRYRKVRR